MKYFEALMVKRNRESIARLNGEIADLEAQIAALPAIRWFKKRQLKQLRKDLLSMVRGLENEIKRVTG